MELALIAAINENYSIGKDGTTLYRIPEDMSRFRKLTWDHPVIMGRKTYESIPKRFRPLKRRTNIVVTRQQDFNPQGVVVVNSIDDALAAAEEALRTSGKKTAYVIGGQQIYEQTIGLATRLEITHIFDDAQGDAFFPKFDINEWRDVFHQNGKGTKLRYVFVTYQKITSPSPLHTPS